MPSPPPPPPWKRTLFCSSIAQKLATHKHHDNNILITEKNMVEATWKGRQKALPDLPRSHDPEKLGCQNEF
jgi:hypothetical protein